MGALNFYAEQPHSFDDDAMELGLMLATHVAAAWNMVRRDLQFRSAWHPATSSARPKA